MPELPEVETVKETLKQLALGKRIDHVEVFWPKMIKRPDDASVFQLLLKQQTIRDIERRGKFLRFILDDYTLVSHLRMEGRYRLAPAKEARDKHTHVIFYFDDGTALHYRDVRKFGTMHLFKKGEEWNHPPLDHLGPEPLCPEFSMEYLSSKLISSHRPIKAALLDQTLVVGLGNIYVDEALFRAGIHPERHGSTFSEEEVGRLLSSIKSTLSEAVQAGGSTIRSYVNSQGQMGMFQQQLFVYGQTGQACQNCGTPIEKFKLAGRGTHICPQCQL